LIASPDLRSSKMAWSIQALNARLALIENRPRVSRETHVPVSVIATSRKNVILCDDMIATGGRSPRGARV